MKIILANYTAEIANIRLDFKNEKPGRRSRYQQEGSEAILKALGQMF